MNPFKKGDRVKLNANGLAGLQLGWRKNRHGYPFNWSTREGTVVSGGTRGWSRYVSVRWDGNKAADQWSPGLLDLVAPVDSQYPMSGGTKQ